MLKNSIKKKQNLQDEKFRVGEKWRIFGKVTKIFPDEYFYSTNIIK